MVGIIFVQMFSVGIDFCFEMSTQTYDSFAIQCTLHEREAFLIARFFEAVSDLFTGNIENGERIEEIRCEK